MPNVKEKDVKRVYKPFGYRCEGCCESVDGWMIYVSVGAFAYVRLGDVWCNFG